MLEFDPVSAAAFGPGPTQRRIDAAEAAIRCFFTEVIDRAAVGGRELMRLPSLVSTNAWDDRSARTR